MELGEMGQTGESASSLSINAERLISDFEELRQIGRLPTGGLGRASFSPADGEAREWFFGRCADAGLTVRTDGIGNIMVSSPAIDPAIAGLAPVWAGSHIDAVPNGGAFDGPLGVLAALECLRRIHEEGIQLERPVQCVIYADEEGNYSHLLGSSALARGFTREELESMTGRDGDRFVDTFAAVGGSVEDALGVTLAPGAVHATVELHIEQGPLLEQRNEQIGVVSGIVALGGGVVTFLGRADHAGTTPMRLRKDASIAAGALLVALPAVAAAVSERAVVTSGIIAVEPGASNVIPGSAQVTVDFREPDAEALEALEAGIIRVSESIAAEYGLTVEFDFGVPIAPSPMDEGIRSIISAAAEGRGLAWSALPSGAGHDSQNMATIAPTGMIFVPSIGGRSHCPEENTAWADVENGANVLLDTVIQLARRSL
jgi:N-carbamoyl-L-amino-acid hydrolase